jgi:hypothetical protein
MRARIEACPVKVSKENTARTLRNVITLVPFILVVSAVAHAQTASPSPPSAATSAAFGTADQDQAQEQLAPAVATNEQPLAGPGSGQFVLGNPMRLKRNRHRAMPVVASSMQPESEVDSSVLAEHVRLAWARAESASSTPPGAAPDASATPDPSDPSPGGQQPPDPATGQPAPAPPPNPAKTEPLAFADWTWMTGNPRTSESPIDMKYFTGEIRFDANYTQSFNNPIDDTISGSTEIFRTGEFQLNQAGIGGDFHYGGMRGRIMTQFGMYSETTPRNDASPARGGWDLDTAYRYISEAYGGYHWDALHGVNLDMGIFMSYIGLWSYYSFDNWTYQPSYVSSNTPWFFNGMRMQIWPTDKLKFEPWLINGWQSYGKFNNLPGVGGQILYRPNGNVAMVFNNYYGKDDLGIPDRHRIHTDDSIQIKEYSNKDGMLDLMAMSFTVDLGCEYGGAAEGQDVSCHGGTPASPSQFFAGFMTYQHAQFAHDHFGFTVGGGAINNPGRYLVLIPPINGATAISGTPYFPENPGSPYKAWDMQVTFDYMPSQFCTLRSEYVYRHASVPYFTGHMGVTPPNGDYSDVNPNQPIPPQDLIPGWAPDLVKSEGRVTFAVLVKL